MDKGKNKISYTDFADSSVNVSITALSYFEMGGSGYLVTGDTAVGGTPATGLCYILATPATTAATIAWTTTAPAWRDDFQGYYATVASVVRALGGCNYVANSYNDRWVYGIKTADMPGSVITTIKVAAGAITETKLGASAVTEGKLGASAVAQGKLKTATGSVNVVINAASYNYTASIPGGEYGFNIQCKASVINDLETGLHGDVAGLTSPSGGYWTTGYLSPGVGFENDSASSRTGYAQVRYITSSGEVHWIFILRDKVTKENRSIWQAPDHPCFGNGGKPQLFPHPFGKYDTTKYEIIVVTPDKGTVKAIKTKCNVDDRLFVQLSVFARRSPAPSIL